MVAAVSLGCGDRESGSGREQSAPETAAQKAKQRPAERLGVAENIGEVFPRGSAQTVDLSEGTRKLEGVPGRDTRLYIPPDVGSESPAGLVLSLHGAHGDADNGLGHMFAPAERHRLLVLAPSSAGKSWSQGDIPMINAALRHVLRRYPVERRRIAISGFSAGGSLALTLGLANGDLFKHILVFSPGSVPDVPRVGKPQIYVVYGDQEAGYSPQEIARLRKQGYDVTYREFSGGHRIDRPLVAQGIEQLLPPPTKDST